MPVAWMFSAKRTPARTASRTSNRCIGGPSSSTPRPEEWPGARGGKRNGAPRSASRRTSAPMPVTMASTSR